jgi:predicted transcriptional regulator
MSADRHTPRLDGLLARLREDLQTRGRAAELARILQAEHGITFQAAKNRVSHFRHGHSRPTGEDTLILLEFLASGH